MKFKKDDLQELLSLGIDDIGFDGLKLVECGDWIGDGKYEIRNCVFSFNGKFYEINESRTGSHYTDWYYSWENETDEVECVEVFPAIKYKHGFSVNPSFVVVLDLKNEECWKAWNNTDYERELKDLLSYYGGEIIKRH